jgi:hypothetical protein
MIIPLGLAAIRNSFSLLMRGGGFAPPFKGKMRFILLFFSAALFFFSCHCDGIFPSNTEPKLSINVLKVDSPLSGLFLCSTGEYLYGFDTLAYSLKAKIQFNTFIQYGANSPGRVFLSDQGTQTGFWGDRLLVLNDNGSLIKEVPCRSIPTDVRIFGSKFFVGASGMLGGADEFPLQAFDLNSYAPLNEYTVQGMATGDCYSVFGSDLYVAIKNYTETPGRSCYILHVDLNTLTATRHNELASVHDVARINVAVADSFLTVSYNIEYDIEAFNRISYNKLSSVNLLSDTNTNFLISDTTRSFLFAPKIFGKELFVLLSTPVTSKNSFIVYSLPDLSFQRIISISTSSAIDINNYYYTSSGLFVSYGSDTGFFVINPSTGAVLFYTALD